MPLVTVTYRCDICDQIHEDTLAALPRHWITVQSATLCSWDCVLKMALNHRYPDKPVTPELVTDLDNMEPVSPSPEDWAARRPVTPESDNLVAR